MPPSEFYGIGWVYLFVVSYISFVLCSFPIVFDEVTLYIDLSAVTMADALSTVVSSRLLGTEFIMVAIIFLSILDSE